MSDTSEQWRDRATNLEHVGGKRGGSANNPKCVICDKSTRGQEGAIFCSKGCEHKAYNFRGGTTMQRAVAKARTVDPYYASMARRLDEGYWPGRSLQDKAAQLQRRWKDQ